jgi:hypothetical protein
VSADTERNESPAPATPDSDTADMPPCQPDAAEIRPRGDRYIRWAAVGVVLVLAGVAAFVSYHHQYGLAIKNGEPEATARWFPIVIDGVIVMASLVMLYCARLRLPVPRLAYFALWAGIVATLVANAAHGWDGGWTSRLVSAAPAAVLVIAYELLMWLIRTMRKSAPEKVVERLVYRDREIEKLVEVETPLIPSDKFEAARWAFEDSIRGGRRGLGRRALADRFGLETREAIEIIEDVKREQEPALSEPDPKPGQNSVSEPPIPPIEPTRLNGSHPAPTGAQS